MSEKIEMLCGALYSKPNIARHRKICKSCPKIQKLMDELENERKEKNDLKNQLLKALQKTILCKCHLSPNNKIANVCIEPNKFMHTTIRMVWILDFVLDFVLDFDCFGFFNTLWDLQYSLGFLLHSFETVFFFQDDFPYPIGQYKKCERKET